MNNKLRLEAIEAIKYEMLEIRERDKRLGRPYGRFQKEHGSLMIRYGHLAKYRNELLNIGER